jgi:hypothetical protein
VIKTLATLLAVSIGALSNAAQAEDMLREPGFETLRFAPADYSPYNTRRSTQATYPGVDWSALAPSRPEPRVAIPAVIRMPADPRPPRH